MGLQIAAADAGIAPGAADHLVEKLEGALGGARIAVGEAEIGVDHADQIEHREVMALGDQLGADDDVEAAGGDVGKFLAHPLDRGDQIARQHQHARIGKQLAHLFFQPLDAGPDRRERIHRLRSSGTRPDAAWRSRNDGRRAAGGSDDRPARRRNSDRRSESRRRGTRSAARSRGD